MWEGQSSERRERELAATTPEGARRSLVLLLAFIFALPASIIVGAVTNHFEVIALPLVGLLPGMLWVMAAAKPSESRTTTTASHTGPIGKMHPPRPDLVCARCHAPTSAADRDVKCAACGALVHAACWKAHGRCTTADCAGEPVAI